MEEYNINGIDSRKTHKRIFLLEKEIAKYTRKKDRATFSRRNKKGEIPHR